VYNILSKRQFLIKHEASLLFRAFEILYVKNPKLRNKKMANLRVFKNVKEGKQNKKKKKRKK
jgi:hypothetical protein